MTRRRLAFLAALALLATGGACLLEPQFPGDELLGNYDFTATRVAQAADAGGCVYEEIDAGEFTFSATFSHLRGTTQAWMTVKNVVRDAGFDGQVLDSFAVGPRRFARCDCEGLDVELEETLRLVLLSSSQDQALRGGCPDGGGAPVDEDAGIFPPRSTSSGFDAVRACGSLTDAIVVSNLGESVCRKTCAERCAVQYTVEGVRR